MVVQLLGRVKETFRERLEMFVCKNGCHLGDVILENK